MARLDLNLASRPFVNQRPLVLATALLAGLLVLFSFFNVYWLFGALHGSWRLKEELAANRAEIAQARAASERLAASISDRSRRRIRSISVATREIIEKRRLSWTRLFDQLEAVMPRDVRVLSILPSVRGEKIEILMEATAKDNEVKLKFYRKLQERPFRDAYILGETIEADKIQFQVRCSYDPEGGDAIPIHEPMPWELPSPTPLQAAANRGPATAASSMPSAGANLVPMAATPKPTPREVVAPELLGGFAPAEEGAAP